MIQNLLAGSVNKLKKPEIFWNPHQVKLLEYWQRMANIG